MSLGEMSLRARGLGGLGAGRCSSRGRGLGRAARGALSGGGAIVLVVAVCGEVDGTLSTLHRDATRGTGSLDESEGSFLGGA